LKQTLALRGQIVVYEHEHGDMVVGVVHIVHMAHGTTGCCFRLELFSFFGFW
jgi:hypothetical protein